MMKLLQQLIALLLLIALAVGCSGKESSDAVVAGGGGGAAEDGAGEDNAPEEGSIIAAKTLFESILPSITAITTDTAYTPTDVSTHTELPKFYWHHTSFFNNNNGGPDHYIKLFFDTSDSDAVIVGSVDLFKYGCLIESYVPLTSGQLTVGTHTKLVTQEMVDAGVCFPTAEFTNFLGATLSFTVTALSGGSDEYSHRVELSAEIGVQTMPLGVFYITNTASELKLLQKAQSVDGADVTTTVTSFELNKATNVGFLQYVRVNEDGGNAHSQQLVRVFFDEGNNTVKAFSHYRDATGTPTNTEGQIRKTTFGIATSYTNQTQFALSLSSVQVTGYADLEDGSACINKADASIVENETDTCTSNSQTAPTASTGVTTFSHDLRELDDDVMYSNEYNDILPTFNATTINTATIGFTAVDNNG